MKEQLYSYWPEVGDLITIHACTNCGCLPAPRYMGEYKIALVCETCGKHVIASTLGNGAYSEWNRINPIPADDTPQPCHQPTNR